MALLKPFTTEPKTRRHGNFISGDRCRVFMEHCWEKGLRKKASWETLEFEFVQCFETNDSRTVQKYVGRPSKFVNYQASNMVRINHISGKVAQFSYRTTRKVSRKRGLLEALGYITFCGDGCYRFNHEVLPYYTQQITLEVSPQSPLQEVNSECVDVAKDDSSARCDERVERDTGPIAELPRTSVGEEKKEEVIECTHTNPYSNSNMGCRACSVYSGEVVC